MAGLVLVLVCCVCAGAVLLVARQLPRDVDPGAAEGSGSATDREPGSDDARAKAATALLGRLGVRLERGTRHQVVALGSDRRAALELVTLRHNVRALGVTDLTMRYLHEGTGQLSGAQRAALGQGSWVGEVRLRWRLRGFDGHYSQLKIPVAFEDDGPRARFVTARLDAGGAAPMWLLERVSVKRTARSMVVTSGAGQVAAYSRLADRAAVDVLAVLRRWPGRLVVEVPGGRNGLSRVLGSDPSDYAEIAAVTTTADGSAEPQAPVHIFVNPGVFDSLGPRASQIVMSHEAAHVATGAALSSMPTWLLEGFADYIALLRVDLPVEVTASQILALVREDGAPSRLPGPDDFAPSSKDLGAAYESAWLACRLLGETYGERLLVEFYRASDRDSSTSRSFRTVLGTDERAFTRAWRSELHRLAS